VVKHGGHVEAIPFIKALPRNMQSQSLKYAPEVSARFVAWHQHMQKEEAVPVPEQSNPFDVAVSGLEASHKALIETLLLFVAKDKAVDGVVNVQDGMTELTLIFPGELHT
jgi:hypothetical protein